MSSGDGHSARHKAGVTRLLRRTVLLDKGVTSILMILLLMRRSPLYFKGVQSAAVNVICELARRNPKNYLSLAPLFFKLMTSSTNNWVLIKIIKLASIPPELPFSYPVKRPRRVLGAPWGCGWGLESVQSVPAPSDPLASVIPSLVL